MPSVWIDPLSHKFLREAGTISAREGQGPVLLMYHGTPDRDKRLDSPYDVPARQFSRHLDLLQEYGWSTARICDLAHTEHLPDKTVVLTLDDGFSDNFEGAFAPLAKRGMRATWFIVSKSIGANAHWIRGASSRSPIISQGQLKELVSAGMEIGSHTRRHPDLTGLGPDNLADEIAGSKLDLEEMLGREVVVSFAYPYGRFNNQVVESVRQAGYRFACTVRPGWFGSERDMFRLRRVTMFSHDSLGEFARKLAFADNDVGWGRIWRYSAGRFKERLISEIAADERKG